MAAAAGSGSGVKRKSSGDGDVKAPPQFNKRVPKPVGAGAFRSVEEGHSDLASVLPPQEEIGPTIDQLSDEQLAVVKAIQQGRSVFFTGAAGTGKSFLLQYLVKTMFANDPSTHVTATTGLAAVNIGGITLHSWAKIGLGRETAATYIDQFKFNQTASRRWRSTKRLVVDEVSMLGPDLLDKLDLIAKGVRSDGRAMGGIQIIFCGDFLQLPPVDPGNKGDKLFAFDSPVWTALNFVCFNLTKVFRQKDREFVTMLDELRFGILSPKSEAMLEACRAKKLPAINGILPTKLLPKRVEVSGENDAELQKLKSPEHVFLSSDSGQPPFLKLLEQCQAPARLCLKVGAQVMLLKNDPPNDLGNGSRGLVVGFTKPTDANPYAESVPIVRFVNGRMIAIERQVFEMGSKNHRECAKRDQIPLALAWALTVHKSQGQTLDRAELHLLSVFEEGQVYVSISRVKSTDGLCITGLTRSGIKANRRAVEWYRRHFPDSAPKPPPAPAPTTSPAAAAAAAASSRRPAAAAAASSLSKADDYADADLDAALAASFDTVVDASTAAVNSTPAMPPLSPDS